MNAIDHPGTGPAPTGRFPSLLPSASSRHASERSFPTLPMLRVPGASPTSEYSARLPNEPLQPNIRRSRSTPNFNAHVEAGAPFVWYSYASDHQQQARNVPQLPIELIDRIIDFLHDDNVSLQNCSLVCAAWRDAALHHMFWTMHLLSTSRFRKFVHVSCFRPRIGQYVRAMHLSFPKIPDGFQALIPSIPHTLMPNLRFLGLQHTGHVPVVTDLLDHPMFSNVSRLSLTHVWFCSFSDFRALISTFHRLRDLSIGNVTWDHDDPPSPVCSTAVAPRSRLRSLDLHFNGNFGPYIIRWILSTRMLEELQSLNLYLESTYVAEPFNQVLATVGETLENLTLQMGAIFYSTPQAVEIIRGLTLAPCVRLSSLHLAPSASGHPPNAAWMVDALRTLPASCTTKTLQHVSLQFSLWDAAHWGMIIDLALLETELATPEAPAAYPSFHSTSRIPIHFGIFDRRREVEKYATVRDSPSAARTGLRPRIGLSRPLTNLRYAALQTLSFHVRADTKFNIREFVLARFPTLRRRAEVSVQQVWC